ncbi:MAG: MBL fold metallo-hydrolase [Actinobacteria bacterium]|jgi:glyoxylase-like metal-dependent hydrolase (beta-lactamase superfamily II)|nr:MBL fold metallo-hydrolase [Actinomycetota bacterium]
MAGSQIPFALGLHEVAEGCHAYLQPDGGWGYSNAGLIVGDGASLLVDTLFDLDLTAAMLAAMADATFTAPIGTVVNTHANGDHCYGNQLVADREIIASRATAAEMSHVPPAMMAQLNAAPGDVGELFRSFFGDFRFDGIEPTPPTRTFEGRLEVEIGGRAVELIEVGPAHTDGDTIVVVPDARTVYTGDILFIGGAPIVWAGPLENWIAACDLMLGMDIETVVPGHGPVTDKAGVVEVRDYLTAVLVSARECQANGVDAFEAAWQIVRTMQGADTTRNLREFGRIAVNVDTVYRNLDPSYATPNVIEQFRRMAEIEARAARE